MHTDSKATDSVVELPLLPLKDIVVFPHMIVPVFINEDLCINAVEEAEANFQKKIFLSAFSVPNETGEGLKTTLEPPFDVYDIGTICTVMRKRRLPDGRMKVLIQGSAKAMVVGMTSAEGYPRVKVKACPDVVVDHPNSEIEATIRAVRENLEKVVSLGKILSPDILMILEDVKAPGRLADLVAPNLGLKVHEAQKILAINNPVERLGKVHAYLSREIEVFQMQVRIQSQAKEEIGKMQREHYLREQIRVLKSELGDGDPKDELEALWKKMEKVALTTEAKDEVSRQLRRLERMHQDTSEATLTRTHIEAILGLPWGIRTQDNLSLKHVIKTLDDDHYGLQQVKDRIIEYLAVKKLNPDARSPIICFIGPPGVGKTSLGRSIAKAMGREFSRISLGGVRDEADIRGHRKTYVGAFPGRVIQSIKQSETANPIIMLDEIDKLGSDHRGDPAAALLEVLDPEQNSKFVDHYLGVAFDLSGVMFIANANSIETIPHALRDRLEIIEVSGYSEDEKQSIANQFLIPKQIRETGLETSGVHFTKPAVQSIIRGYTRESGLRGLEKQFASVCRKIARQFAEFETDEDRRKVARKVTPATVEKLLGAKKFDDEFYHAEAAVGVSLGLAYTQHGGEILAIETNLIPGKANLVLTGQLGDVMKESAQAALSFIRSRSSALGIDVGKLEGNEIHLHVPAGAVPKDGPSAGVAIATSMLSALLGRAPRERTCMTGEITLHGKVLPIGGLKEKVLAAQREGMDTIILPSKNKAAYLALPENVKRTTKVEFVKEFNEAFEILFGDEKALGKLSGAAGHLRDVSGESSGLAS
jgi:ATP-dependent Lon protease